MTEAFAKQIETEARQAMTELVAAAKLKKGDVLVVGCSSSEMVGGHIGKDSSMEAAAAVLAGVLFGLLKYGDPQKAMQFGNATSSVKNTVPGDLPSSDFKEIDRIIREHNATGPVSEMNR